MKVASAALLGTSYEFQDFEDLHDLN